MYCILNLSGKGRALVARKDIKAGELVLEEEPAFLIVDEDYLGSVCALCLKKIANSGKNSD